MKQLKILLSAYACEPELGSEYGVGWNVATNMAEYNDVYVLTRGYCKEKIEKELKIRTIHNLHFIYFDIPKLLFFNEKKNWGEQINYLIWQLLSILFVKKLQKKHFFDLFHHITFIQYRTPSAGFFLNIPFVIGPIGGAETIAASFVRDLDIYTKKKEKIRRKGKDIGLFSVLSSLKKNKKAFIFASKQNVSRLASRLGKSKIYSLPAIAFSPEDFEHYQSNQKEEHSYFSMIYAGRAEDWKGIEIYLSAVKRAFSDDKAAKIKVKLIGIRYEHEKEKVTKWICDLNLSPQVELIPFMPRNELINEISRTDLFIYPAFRDSGSMAVLEACVLGCPVICFDAGGQDIFPDEIVMKIPVSEVSYEDNLKNLSDKLLWASNNNEEILKIGIRAKKYAYENFTWKHKVEVINKIYKEILS